MRCFNCMEEFSEDIEYCPYCGKKPMEDNPPHRLAVGTVLNNRYLVGATIGEGGFGITYVGYDQSLNLKVAIKEYFPSGIATRNHTVSDKVTLNITEQTEYFQDGKERFMNEARNIARFASEDGIVDVRDYFTANDTAYIVMEYLDGIDLSKYLQQNGIINPSDAFELMMPLMRTLSKMHKEGVIHRDIAPDNIMRLNNGKLKLMDFGSARHFLGDEIKTMSVLLKQGYSPVEQYSSRLAQGPWTDVYSLCATIYKCITGVTPVSSLDRSIQDDLKKPSELGIDIPPALEAVLMKGLAVNPSERLQNTDELMHAVEATYMGVSPVDSSQVNKSPKPQDDDSYKTVFADGALPSDNGSAKANGRDAYPPINNNFSEIVQKPRNKNIVPIAVISAVVVCVLVAGIILLVNGMKGQPTNEPDKSSAITGETSTIIAEAETTSITEEIETTAPAYTTESLLYHKVDFINYDGSIISSQQVLDGKAATPPANPTKPSDAYYDYVFKSWGLDYSCVQSDMTIAPIYEPQLKPEYKQN